MVRVGVRIRHTAPLLGFVLVYRYGLIELGFGFGSQAYRTIASQG